MVKKYPDLIMVKMHLDICHGKKGITWSKSILSWLKIFWQVVHQKIALFAPGFGGHRNLILRKTFPHSANWFADRR
jgi:hypothetical protein